MQATLCCDVRTYNHEITAQSPTSLYIPYVEIDRLPPRGTINADVPPPPPIAHPHKPMPMPIEVNEQTRDVTLEGSRPHPYPMDIAPPHIQEDFPETYPPPSHRQNALSVSHSVLDSQLGPKEFVEHKNKSAGGDQARQYSRNFRCCQGAEDRDTEYRPPSGGPGVYSPRQYEASGLCGWGRAPANTGPTRSNITEDVTFPARPHTRDRAASMESPDGMVKDRRTNGGIFSMCRSGADQAGELTSGVDIVRGSGDRNSWRDPEFVHSSEGHVPCDHSIPVGDNLIIQASPANWSVTAQQERPRGNAYSQSPSPPAGGKDGAVPPFMDGPSPTPGMMTRPLPADVPGSESYQRPMTVPGSSQAVPPTSTRDVPPDFPLGSHPNHHGDYLEKPPMYQQANSDNRGSLLDDREGHAHPDRSENLTVSMPPRHGAGHRDLPPPQQIQDSSWKSEPERHPAGHPTPPVDEMTRDLPPHHHDHHRPNGSDHGYSRPGDMTRDLPPPHDSWHDHPSRPDDMTRDLPPPHDSRHDHPSRPGDMTRDLAPPHSSGHDHSSSMPNGMTRDLPPPSGQDYSSSRPSDVRGPGGENSTWGSAMENEREVPKKGGLTDTHPSQVPDYGQGQTIHNVRNKSWSNQVGDVDDHPRPGYRDMPPPGAGQNQVATPADMSYRQPDQPGHGNFREDGIDKSGVMQEEKGGDDYSHRDRDGSTTSMGEGEPPQKGRKGLNFCCGSPVSDSGDTYVLQLREIEETYEGFTPGFSSPQPMPKSLGSMEPSREGAHNRGVQKAGEAAHALTKRTATMSNSQTIHTEKFVGRLDRQTLENEIIRPAEEAVSQQRPWESKRYPLSHPNQEPLYVRFHVENDGTMRNELRGPPSNPKVLRDSTFELTTVVLPSPARNDSADPLVYSDTFSTLPGDGSLMIKERESFVTRPSDLRHQSPDQLLLSVTQITASCCAMSSLRADMERLYRSNDYNKTPTPIADCTVVCEKQIFPANRAMLIARSKVFGEMLAAKTRAVIAVSGASPDVVRSLMDFVHTDRCVLLDVSHDLSSSIRLFETAVRFGVVSLANELAVRLSVVMDSQNIDRMEAAAKKTKHAYLFEAVNVYKAAN